MKNMSKFIVNESMSIRDVVIHMNNKQIQIVICKNKAYRKILGIFTEGDFRRLIFRGYNIDDPIGIYINKNFHYVTKKSSDANIIKIFKKNKIDYLPVLNSNNLVNILYRNNFKITKTKNIKKKISNNVIIMAGGKGTRMDPFTRVLPKALIPIGDEPVIKLIMSNFKKYGVKDFTVSLYEKSEMVKAYFNQNKSSFKINYLEETFPMGTVGSLSLLKKKFNKPFFLINCDVLINVNYEDIINFHKKNKNVITMVASLKRSTIPYGVCKVDKNGNLLDLVEKPSTDNLIVTGLYLMNPEIVDLIPNNRSFDFPQLIEEAYKKKYTVGVYPISQNSFNDVGQWDLYNKTIMELEEFNS